MARVGRKGDSFSDSGSDILGDEATVSRLDTIKEAAKRVMARNFVPSEEDLDLESWGFEDD